MAPEQIVHSAGGHHVFRLNAGRREAMPDRSLNVTQRKRLTAARHRQEAPQDKNQPTIRCRRIAFGALIATATLTTGAQEIVVGQVLSLKGPNATTAEELSRGRKACADLVNSQGGIRGRMLRLITRDDQADPALALKVARDLVERDQAVALLGSMGPATNEAIIEWAGNAGVALIGPYGGDIEVRLHDTGVAFHLTANQSAEAERLGVHTATLGVSRAVVVAMSDRTGTAARVALEEGLTVANVRIVGVAAVKTDGSDADQVAASVAAAKPDAVLLATSGRATVAMLNELHAAWSSGGRPLQVYGLSSAVSPRELQALGGFARGFSMSQVLPLPRDGRVPVVATFLRAMQGAANERTYAELEGCVGSLVLAEALRRKPTDLTRAGVLRALKTAGRVDLGGFDVELSDRARLGSKFTDIVFVGTDGRLVR